MAQADKRESTNDPARVAVTAAGVISPLGFGLAETGLCDSRDALFSRAMPMQNCGPGFRLASACQPRANTSFGTPASRVAHDDSGAARTHDATA